jgi:hypothetical protein
MVIGEEGLIIVKFGNLLKIFSVESFEKLFEIRIFATGASCRSTMVSSK